MTPLNGNGLLATAPTVLVATPVFFPTSDQDAPTTKPTGKPPKTKGGPNKGKPKGKPKSKRDLIELEVEAIKRIAKIDKKLAKKLNAKLPGKNTPKQLSDYIRKRIRKLDDERNVIKGMEKTGIFRPDRKKEIKDLEVELKDLLDFYNKRLLPLWYVKFLEDQKKAKAKQQPAGPAPTSRPVVASRIPEGILLTFTSEN